MGDVQWADLNQEAGELSLQIYPRRDGQPWIFNWEEALTILQRAKQRLLEH
jgi:hypothetical protein